MQLAFRQEIVKMEWPAAPQAGDLPSKEFNFSRGIKGTLALRDLFGLLAHLELTRAEQHYIVDLCLGLKGATKLYGLLGKGEKERGENPLLQRKKNAKAKKQQKEDEAAAKAKKDKEAEEEQKRKDEGGVVRLPPMGVALKDVEDKDANNNNKKTTTDDEGKALGEEDEGMEEGGGRKGTGETGNDDEVSMTSTDEMAKAMGLPQLVSYKDLLAALDPDPDTLKMIVHDLTRKAIHDKDKLKEERDKVTN